VSFSQWTERGDHHERDTMQLRGMKGKLLFLWYIIAGEKAAERKCQYRGPPRRWKLIFNLSQKRKSVSDSNGIYRAAERKREERDNIRSDPAGVRCCFSTRRFEILPLAFYPRGPSAACSVSFSLLKRSGKIEGGASGTKLAVVPVSLHRRL